jgi:anti-sigma regulatory factor (Ser/Thr protein kinase)/PAS domain-containing protein
MGAASALIAVPLDDMAARVDSCSVAPATRESPSEDPPARVERRLPAVPESVGEARAALRAFGQAHGVAPELLEGVLLSVSEAATNAVVHAFVDRAPGTLEVVAVAAPDRLTVSVVDDGVGMRPRPDSPGLGLGLPTIGQLAGELDIRPAPAGGTEVRMTFAAPGLRGPEPAAEPGGRYELLAEVARLVGGRGWPQDGVDQLVHVLVPAVADASAIDVLDEGGIPRRMAGQLSGPGSEADSRWLTSLEPRVGTPGSATAASLRELRPRQVELTPDHIAAITRSEEDARRMAATGVRWWVVVPLLDQERLLGLLHCGRRADRGRFNDTTIDFLATVAERAARGLANTQLVAELRRTRARLERILGALTEAVTVHDAAGRIVFANDAAARLLGLAGVRDILDAAPGLLAARYILSREDGSPVAVDDLPGRQVLAGGSGEPLLVRSVHRGSGAARWLLIRAERLDDELAVNVISEVDGPG